MPTSMRVLACAALLVAAACSNGSSDPVVQQPVDGAIRLTTHQVAALDSTADAIAKANPSNPILRSLADSTTQVLTAGIEAKQLPVVTTITTAPLYFVGIHRAFVRATGSSSTWTLVGFDNPEKLQTLVEVSGFAQSSTGDAPLAVSGTIGDGKGIVNGLMLQVQSGGSVTQWNGAVGTVSFSSGAASGACPGFVATPKVTCSIEQMRVKFTMEGRAESLSSIRTASLANEIDVPTMRLTYTP